MKNDLIVDESVPNIYYTFGRKKEDGYDTSSFHEILYLNKGSENKSKRSFSNNPYLVLIINRDMLGCHVTPSPYQVLLKIGGYGKIENMNCFQDIPSNVKILKEIKLSRRIYNFNDIILKLNILTNLYIAKYILKSKKYVSIEFDKNLNFYKNIIDISEKKQFSFLDIDIKDNEFEKYSLLKEYIIDKIVPPEVVNKIFKKVFEEFKIDIIGI